MEIILLERIEKLGGLGDFVRVKSGYARNFLLPQKKALRATPDNRQRFEAGREQLEARTLAAREEAQKLAERLEGHQFTIIRQSSEADQLYGSVRRRDIVALLAEEEIQIVRNQVVLDSPIKTSGRHEVRIRLHPEISVRIGLLVARSLEASLEEEEEPQDIEEIAQTMFESGAAERFAEKAAPQDADAPGDRDEKTPEE